MIGKAIIDNTPVNILSTIPHFSQLVDDSLKAITGRDSCLYKGDRNTRKYFLFTQDDSENGAKSENTLAVVSALPFMIAGPDSYYYTPAWVIDGLEVSRHLKDSSFGSGVLETIANILKSTTRNSEIFVSVETESVCDTLCRYNKLWETTSETDCPTLYSTYTMRMSSKLDNAERAIAVRKIKGLYSFKEDLAKVEKLILVRGSIKNNSKLGSAVHSFAVTFYSNTSDDPDYSVGGPDYSIGITLDDPNYSVSDSDYYVGSITLDVNMAMSYDGKINFEIDYLPKRTEDFKKLVSAENYIDCVCATIEDIAFMYKNDNNIVTCYTTEKDIMQSLQNRLWRLTPDFSMEYKANDKQVIG